MEGRGLCGTAKPPGPRAARPPAPRLSLCGHFELPAPSPVTCRPRPRALRGKGMNRPFGDERGDAVQAVRVSGGARDRSCRLRVSRDGFVSSRALFDGLGVRTYDPGLAHTAVAKSSICEIDGAEGSLRIRGRRIEELAAAGFGDTAQLLLTGCLPESAAAAAAFRREMAARASVPAFVWDLMRSFPRSAHPMTVLCAAVAALSAAFPESNPAVTADALADPAERRAQALGLVAKMPQLAAGAICLRGGGSFADAGAAAPAAGDGASVAEGFLRRLGIRDRRSAEVLDTILTLHAEHGLNCSTAAVRHVGSAGGEAFAACAAGVAALMGPLHGGAAERVIKMLEEIGDPRSVDAYLATCKGGAGGRRLFGFGHRVYKSYDPRARVIKALVDSICDEGDALVRVARELEARALEDPYFRSRRLFPNVDFYSGLVYRRLGMGPETFSVLFALPRAAGWMAHWLEARADKEQRIMRPRQVSAAPHPRSRL